MDDSPIYPAWPSFRKSVTTWGRDQIDSNKWYQLISYIMLYHIVGELYEIPHEISPLWFIINPDIICYSYNML